MSWEDIYAKLGLDYDTDIKDIILRIKQIRSKVHPNKYANINNEEKRNEFKDRFIEINEIEKKFNDMKKKHKYMIIWLKNRGNLKNLQMDWKV